jgi:hypothetical protein
MKNKIKVHDGVVGALILLSVVLALKVDIQWIYLAGAVSILMILSSVTGFCPVYFILNKVMPQSNDKCC